MLLALTVALPGWAQGEAPTYSKEQLDQLLAPIALYPDSLLTQVLMAATYPAEVAEAVKWSAAHPNDKGDAAATKAESMGWEPSVTSLVAFPQVLATMGQKPEWVQDLGDAFLAQPTDTMDCGAAPAPSWRRPPATLKSNEQQKVVVAARHAAAERDRHRAGATAGGVRADVQPDGGLRRLALSGVPAVLHAAASRAITSATRCSPAWPSAPVWRSPTRCGAATTGAATTSTSTSTATTTSTSTAGSAATRTTSATTAMRARECPTAMPRSNDKYGKNVAGKDARNDYRGRDANDAKRDAARDTMAQRANDPKAREQAGTSRPASRPAGAGGAQDRMAANKDRPGNAGTQNRTAAAKDRPNNAGAQNRMAGNNDRAASAQRPQRPAPASRENALSGAGNGNAQRAQVDRGQASRQASAAARPQQAAGTGPRRRRARQPKRGTSWRRWRWRRDGLAVAAATGGVDHDALHYKSRLRGLHVTPDVPPDSGPLPGLSDRSVAHARACAADPIPQRRSSGRRVRGLPGHRATTTHMHKILGPEYRSLHLEEATPDDKLNFLSAWAKKHRVVAQGDNRAVLEVGETDVDAADPDGQAAPAAGPSTRVPGPTS